MRFIVMVRANGDTEAGVMPSTESLAAMGKFNEEMVKAGIMLAGEGLHPSMRATRLKFSGPRPTIVDGPFPARELVCGFWMLQAKSKEEVIDWMKRAPFGGDAEIEIRQVFDADDFGAEFTPEMRAAEEHLRAQAAKNASD